VAEYELMRGVIGEGGKKCSMISNARSLKNSLLLQPKGDQYFNPVSDCMVTEVKFIFDLVSRIEAEDVVIGICNFQDCHITQLEPTAVPNGRCSKSPDSSNTLFRHRQLNPSKRSGSADYITSRSHILHCTLFRMSSTSLRN
jgi:hypothetical protein